VSDQIIGSPPKPEQIVVAIHNLQFQINCLLSAVAILADAASPETKATAAKAVRASASNVKSAIYPGKEDAMGMQHTADAIAEMIAKLFEIGKEPECPSERSASHLSHLSQGA